MNRKCTKCGETKPLDSFRLAKSGRSGRSAQCKKCYNLYTSRHRASLTGEVKERIFESKRRCNARYQSKISATKRSALNAQHADWYGEAQTKTKNLATRKGFVWTGPELELAERRDLTTKDVAFMTGRTYFAVVNKRHLLRAKDPLTMALHGEQVF